jgi:hypothetical protein
VRAGRQRPELTYCCRPETSGLFCGGAFLSGENARLASTPRATKIDVVRL